MSAFTCPLVQRQGIVETNMSGARIGCTLRSVQDGGAKCKYGSKEPGQLVPVTGQVLFDPDTCSIDSVSAGSVSRGQKVHLYRT